MDGFYDADHLRGPHNLPAAGGSGGACDSEAMAAWQPNVFDAWGAAPSCIPQQDGSGPFEPSPVPWIPTIMDRLDEAGLDWRLYTTPEQGQPGYNWAICPTFADCLYTAQHDRTVDRSEFLTDAAAGTLPAFSVLTPDPVYSQHNTRSMMQGDNWIAEQVTAVMNGPDWASTAVFLTWDDCGCFYDHVPPPPDLGIREPMVIISPYARPGFTDSTVASFASIMAFTERTFGIAPLSNIDRDAYGYEDAFDYEQVPLGPIPVPQHEVPEASIRWLTHHPPNDDDDPT